MGVPILDLFPRYFRGGTKYSLRAIRISRSIPRLRIITLLEKRMGEWLKIWGIKFQEEFLLEVTCLVA